MVTKRHEKCKIFHLVISFWRFFGQGDNWNKRFQSPQNVRKFSQCLYYVFKFAQDGFLSDYIAQYCPNSLLDILVSYKVISRYLLCMSINIKYFFRTFQNQNFDACGIFYAKSIVAPEKSLKRYLTSKNTSFRVNRGFYVYIKLDWNVKYCVWKPKTVKLRV